MKHHELVEFLSNFQNVKPRCNVKPLIEDLLATALLRIRGYLCCGTHWQAGTEFMGGTCPPKFWTVGDIIAFVPPNIL